MRASSHFRSGTIELNVLRFVDHTHPTSVGLLDHAVVGRWSAPPVGTREPSAECYAAFPSGSIRTRHGGQESQRPTGGDDGPRVNLRMTRILGELRSVLWYTLQPGRTQPTLCHPTARPRTAE
jgi:hypothetical protein